MTQFTWKPKKRNYLSVTSNSFQNISHNHPLQNIYASSKPKSEVIDSGRNLVNAFEGLDPLSQMSADQTVSPDAFDILGPTHESISISVTKFWISQKQVILGNFTTSEKLTINTISLGERETVLVKNSCTISEKVRHRLEQLDEFEEGSVKMSNLTQQEYIHHLEQLSKALTEAWEMDQKVKALKIAIQCAKLLSNTDVIKFYPSQFILITDILDNFGRLVYQRLSNMAESYSSDGCQSCKNEAAWETCNNWFYKIASIRELIPRLYVEVAILPCYKFLDEGKIQETLLRLTSSVNGIANPMVSIHLLCYICKVGLLAMPHYFEHTKISLEYLCNYHLKTDYCPVGKSIIDSCKGVSTWASLCQPAVEIICFCFNASLDSKNIKYVFDVYANPNKSVLVLAGIIKYSKPGFIGLNIEKIVNLCQALNPNDFGVHEVYKHLGSLLINNTSLIIEQEEVFRSMWPLIIQITEIKNFILCVEVWAHYAAAHLKEEYIDAILKTITSKLGNGALPEKLFVSLKNIVKNMFSYMTNFFSIFKMENFFNYLDLFSNKLIQVETYKIIMESFSQNSNELLFDPVINSALIHICKVLHDSLNFLSLSDEKRQISKLICSYIVKVQFKRDFEQQLTFYVNCRSNFSALDSVLVLLVQLVNQLAVKTCIIVRSSHTKKTAAFVRACIAYCFITIPSISNVMAQLNLYLLTSQTALKSQCFGQANSCLKAITVCLNEKQEPGSTLTSFNEFKISFIANLMSTLLYTPDFMDQSILYLFKEVLKLISAEDDDVMRVQLYVKSLCLLSGYFQTTYLYKSKEFDSNDVLYGSHPKYKVQLDELSQYILTETLSSLKCIGNSKSNRDQADLSLLLFNCVLAHADIEHTGMGELLRNLWNLSHKLNPNSKIYKQFERHLRLKMDEGEKGYDAIVQNLSTCKK